MSLGRRNRRANCAFVLRLAMDRPMTNQDPYPRRTSRSPDVDPNPLPPGSNPPRHRDLYRPSGLSAGTITAIIIVVVFVIGILLWATTGGQQTATNAPQQTTGQGKINPAPSK
jgi:hypothetical protein